MVTWYSSPPNEVQRLNLLCDDIAFLCLRNPGPNSRSHTAQKDALWFTRFLRTIIHPLSSPHYHQLPPDSAPHLRTWGKLLCIINPLATMALGVGWSTQSKLTRSQEECTDSAHISPDQEWTWISAIGKLPKKQQIWGLGAVQNSANKLTKIR